MSGQTVAHVLHHAVDLIERDGWRQGVAVGDDRRLCAGEAIVRATTDSHLVELAYNALRDHLGVTFICEWNDLDGQTKAEVLSGLQSAAEHEA